MEQLSQQDFQKSFIPLGIKIAVWIMILSGALAILRSLPIFLLLDVESTHFFYGISCISHTLFWVSNIFEGFYVFIFYYLFPSSFSSDSYSSIWRYILIVIILLLIYAALFLIYAANLILKKRKLGWKLAMIAMVLGLILFFIGIFFNSRKVYTSDESNIQTRIEAPVDLCDSFLPIFSLVLLLFGRKNFWKIAS